MLAPDTVSIGAVMDACARASHSSRWLASNRCLQSLRTSFCEANIILFNSAITACERSSQWATAFQHLHLLCRMALCPDGITRNALLTALRGGFWGRAIELLSISCLTLQRSCVTLNALAAVQANTDTWELALDTLAGMAQEHLEPDVVTLGTQVTTCVSGTQWQRIHRSLRILKLQQKQSLVTLNAAISCPEWRTSLCLAQRTATGEFGCSADVITFNTVASVCEKARRWEQSMLVLQAFQGFRLSPDTCTYNAALSACEKCSQWEKAIHLLAHMADHEVIPDTISYNAAIAACDSCWENALALLHAMQVGTTAVDRISYHSAIGVCVGSRQWEMALTLCKDMLKQNIQADSVSVSLEIGAQEQGGRWVHAVSICRGVAMRGLENNEFTYGATLSACKGRWHVASVLLEERRLGTQSKL